MKTVCSYPKWIVLIALTFLKQKKAIFPPHYLRSESQFKVSGFLCRT